MMQRPNGRLPCSFSDLVDSRLWAIGTIKFAIRRSSQFRFDYFLEISPNEQIGRCCKQMMRVTEKEVEHIEKQAIEDKVGLCLGKPTLTELSCNRRPQLHIQVATDNGT